MFPSVRLVFAAGIARPLVDDLGMVENVYERESYPWVRMASWREFRPWDDVLEKVGSIS